MKKLLILIFVVFSLVNAGCNTTPLPEDDQLSGSKIQGAELQADGTFAYRDTSGNILITSYTFDNGPDYFVEGLSRFVENKKIGFFNEKLEKIIPAQFDWASPFEDGKASICSGCQEISDGEHKMMTGGVWGTVDTNGKVEWRLEKQSVDLNTNIFGNKE